jgi:hypothetical protein
LSSSSEEAEDIDDNDAIILEEEEISSSNGLFLQTLATITGPGEEEGEDRKGDKLLFDREKLQEKVIERQGNRSGDSYLDPMALLPYSI